MRRFASRLGSQPRDTPIVVVVGMGTGLATQRRVLHHTPTLGDDRGLVSTGAESSRTFESAHENLNSRVPEALPPRRMTAPAGWGHRPSEGKRHPSSNGAEWRRHKGRVMECPMPKEGFEFSHEARNLKSKFAGQHATAAAASAATALLKKFVEFHAKDENPHLWIEREAVAVTQLVLFCELSEADMRGVGVVGVTGDRLASALDRIASPSFPGALLIRLLAIKLLLRLVSKPRLWPTRIAQETNLESLVPMVQQWMGVVLAVCDEQSTAAEFACSCACLVLLRQFVDATTATLVVGPEHHPCSWDDVTKPLPQLARVFLSALYKKLVQRRDAFPPRDVALLLSSVSKLDAQHPVASKLLDVACETVKAQVGTVETFVQVVLAANRILHSSSSSSSGNATTTTPAVTADVFLFLIGEAAHARRLSLPSPRQILDILRAFRDKHALVDFGEGQEVIADREQLLLERRCEHWLGRWFSDDQQLPLLWERRPHDVVECLCLLHDGIGSTSSNLWRHRCVAAIEATTLANTGVLDCGETLKALSACCRLAKKLLLHQSAECCCDSVVAAVDATQQCPSNDASGMEHMIDALLLRCAAVLSAEFDEKTSAREITSQVALCVEMSELRRIAHCNSSSTVLEAGAKACLARVVSHLLKSTSASDDTRNIWLSPHAFALVVATSSCSERFPSALDPDLQLREVVKQFPMSRLAQWFVVRQNRFLADAAAAALREKALSSSTPHEDVPVAAALNCCLKEEIVRRLHAMAAPPWRQLYDVTVCDLVGLWALQDAAVCRAIDALTASLGQHQDAPASQRLKLSLFRLLWITSEDVRKTPAERQLESESACRAAVDAARCLARTASAFVSCAGMLLDTFEKRRLCTKSQRDGTNTTATVLPTDITKFLLFGGQDLICFAPSASVVEYMTLLCQYCDFFDEAFRLGSADGQQLLHQGHMVDAWVDDLRSHLTSDVPAKRLPRRYDLSAAILVWLQQRGASSPAPGTFLSRVPNELWTALCRNALLDVSSKSDTLSSERTLVSAYRCRRLFGTLRAVRSAELACGISMQYHRSHPAIRSFSRLLQWLTGNADAPVNPHCESLKQLAAEFEAWVADLPLAGAPRRPAAAADGSTPRAAQLDEALDME